MIIIVFPGQHISCIILGENHPVSNYSFSNGLLDLPEKIRYNCDKVFKNRPRKIYGRQPLKNLKGYGLLEQTISSQIF